MSHQRPRSDVWLGDTAGPSIGSVRFELFLSLLTAAGMAVSGAEVSVSVWVAPELYGRSVHLTPPVGMGYENAGLSG